MADSRYRHSTTASSAANTVSPSSHVVCTVSHSISACVACVTLKGAASVMCRLQWSSLYVSSFIAALEV